MKIKKSEFKQLVKEEVKKYTSQWKNYIPIRQYISDLIKSANKFQLLLKKSDNKTGRINL